MRRIWLRTISLWIAMFLAGVACAAPAVVLVVRHAEKEALPAADPPLTAKGRRRAAELVRVVQAWSAAGAPVRGLFASEAKRTQQTLQPLAASQGITVTVVNAGSTAALVKKILAIKGGIVVVTGHTDTVPGLIQALGGAPGIVIGDAEFDRLFAITRAGSAARVVALHYGEPSDLADASKI